MRATLLRETREGHRAHRVGLVAPEALATAVHPTGWKILSELARKPDYPGSLARRLGMHDQKVYYHVRRLRAAGLIAPVGEGGDGSRTVFGPTGDAFAVLLPGGGSAIAPSEVPSDAILALLQEFAEDGVLNARFVLGAPTPHGPFLTSARDAPYAAHLAMFLGRHLGRPPGMAVKLDTEAKAEGLERGNLVLVGGPIANIVSLDLNPGLPVRFDWSQTWRILSDRTGRSYGDETVGLVAKVPNPWGQGTWVLWFAGLHYPGTIASLLAVTDHADALLDGYSGGELYRVVQGQDRDGDGRVDDVAVLE